MKPKFIPENCDLCETELVHYSEIDPDDAFEDEFYCRKCEGIVIDAEVDVNDGDFNNCLPLEDIINDLSPEMQEAMKEMQEKFPEGMDILISPQAIKDLYILHYQDEKDKKKLN